MIELLTDIVRQVCVERGYALAEVETPHDQDAVSYRLSRAGEIEAVIDISGLEMRATPYGELKALIEGKLDGEPPKKRKRRKKEADDEE